MELVTRVWQSSLGRKYLMGLSGCALFVFVVGHMVGNLQVFLGPEALNRYAHFLQSTPELLWPVRLGLLALVVLHGITATRLWLQNRAARPQGYAVADPLEASYASRTMVVSGVIVGLFIVYHLLHFTLRCAPLNLTGADFRQFHDADGHHDVYRMVIVAFRQPWVSVFYVVSMALLCLHLRHGVQAWFQSLGLRNDSCREVIDRFAWGAALVIFVGNSAIPVSILLGLGKEVVK
jgi:succinate dehydrogenase / fumarate reductase, cytochrome b subunit